MDRFLYCLIKTKYFCHPILSPLLMELLSLIKLCKHWLVLITL